jgi:hypothetical protein
MNIGGLDLQKHEKIVVYGGIFLYLIACLVLAVTMDGTGDAGDSISHFLYAQYAYKHPGNLFHHWAKPFFTFFAAPFSQFGFTGIKVFNCLNTALSLSLVYEIARRLRMPAAFLAPLFLATASMFFTLIFSGLTEHFSALLLLATLLLFIEHKYAWAVTLLSFLPFVRSEGLLFMGVTAVYLVWVQKWRYLPFLALGHVVYGILGAAWHGGDVFWVLNKIPYATLTAYGKGDWGHFVNQLYYASGLPLFVFGLSGILAFGAFLFSRKSVTSRPEYFLQNMTLILAYFFVLIAAHSVFWVLGIFNSFGMNRVLITVLPEFAIIACFGCGYFLERIKSPKTRTAVLCVVAIITALMPFSGNPAGVFFPKNFVRSTDQHLLDEIAQLPQLKGAVVYYSSPNVPFYLHLDPYDPAAAKPLPTFQTDGVLPPNAVLVWDSWFSVIDHHIPLEVLKNDPRLEPVRSFQAEKPPYTYEVFRVKP